MLIDSHLHVWQSHAERPAWSGGPVLAGCDVPIELFDEYMHEHGVDRAVLVQPIYRGEDNSYVADCAVREPSRFAAVCVVDPRLPDAVSKLAYWVRDRGCRGLRLRPRNADEAACFGDPSTFGLWEFAQKHRVVVSLLANFEHLPILERLARQFPETPIVVDHFAFPSDLSPVGLDPIFRLVETPNVRIKISGFYHFSREKYPWSDCRYLVKTVFERFGPERMMWGSDFPHVILKTCYSRTRSFLRALDAGVSDRDFDRIEADTARDLYWGAETK